jgi:hypothetical protein
MQTKGIKVLLERIPRKPYATTNYLTKIRCNIITWTALKLRTVVVEQVTFLISIREVPIKMDLQEVGAWTGLSWLR